MKNKMKEERNMIIKLWFAKLKKKISSVPVSRQPDNASPKETGQYVHALSSFS